MERPKNRPCPMCRSVGRDKKGDHLFLMADNRTWACSKNNDAPPPHAPYYERKGDSSVPTLDQAIASQNENNRRSITVPEIERLGHTAIRSVPADIVGFYQIKMEFDQVTGQPLKHYYPITSNRKLVSYHVRELPKTFFHLHKRSEMPEHIDLFGMFTLNIVPHHLIITEGELDALSVLYMLAYQKRVKKCRALSLPTGNNLSAVQQNAKLLGSVRNLYFCPDQDEAGQKLVPEIWKLFPHIKILSFDEKDAGDMLEKGKTEQFYEAFQRAERYKPSTVVSTKQIKAQAMKPVQAGLAYPFPTLTRLTYGLKTPQLIGIGAAPGAGKTVFMQTLVKHLVYQHKAPVSVFSLEERPSDSLRRMAGHILGLPIHLPNVAYDPKLLAQVIDSLEGKLFYYDHAGYRDWDDIEEVIRFLSFEGVSFFFIDPISALHTHLDASQTNQFLNRAMFAMSRMIHELNITIFITNHLNNPVAGKDHSEGGVVKASQFTGSRSQWRFSTDVWALERDMQNEDPTLANTTTIRILKNRLSGQLGTFNIRFNHATGQLEEPPIPTNF